MDGTLISEFERIKYEDKYERNPNQGKRGDLPPA
jgi:hypothetical protein